jgi:hypothetical protein
MSTLKVTNIQNPSTSSGGVSIDTSGHVTVDGVAMPSAGPLSNRNKIINGDMRIDQRNAGASVTGNNAVYTIDRWVIAASQNSKLTVQQNAGSVTPPAGFVNYLGITSSSAYAVPAGELFNVCQFIEGFNTADLAWGTANARSVVLSFWVRSSLTGTFGGALTNNAQDRSYPFSYSISSANTWEQKTIAVAGDTTGTWLTNNSSGIKLWFGLGVGSTNSGTAGAWAAAQYLSATGATSVVGTNGATFYITGVQLEAGSVATPFEHRSYGQELSLCERYYQLARSGVGAGNTSTGVGMNAVLRTTMRAAPSQALTGAIEVSDGVNDQTQSSASITGLVGTVDAVIFILGNFTGITLNRPYFMRLGANTNAIALSAEL